MLDVLTEVHANRARGVAPRRGSDRSVRTTGYLLAYDDATFTATVSVLGSEPIAGVPTVPSTYTGVTSVYVLLDPDTSRPVQVLGPASTAEVPTEAPPATTSETRTVTGKVIGPAGTGTWRVVRSAWDRWNVAGDVYQGSWGDSGTLYGLAWYGDQVVALGADAITAATLTLVSSGNPGSAWTATVQGCASGTRPAGAPSYTGTTVTATVPGTYGASVSVALDSGQREALRTGGIKSLGLNHTTYGGTTGLRLAPSWYLTLNYTVTG